MIEAIELTSVRAGRGPRRGPRPTMVDQVSFDVYPGQVTALLGPPGSGKSAVLRLMAELEPGRGRTLYGGRPYHALRPAVREVGLALDTRAMHPGRTVNAHLGLYASAGGVPKARLGEVLEVAGLTAQAEVRCGRLDPGQRCRLTIAAALLGDPAALLLDEPHGLDAHGLTWFNALLRAYAAQGRTVLVAVSRPADIAATADHVIVLRRDDEDGLGRVIASRSAAEVFDARRATVVVVRSPQATRLATALEAEGATLASAGPGALEVRGLDRARIGEVAHVAGICLHELAELPPDDSDDFLYDGIVVQRELVSGTGGRAERQSEGDAATWHAGVRVVRVDGGEVGGGGGVAVVDGGGHDEAEIADAEVVEAEDVGAEGVGDDVAAPVTSTVGWPAARAKGLAAELAKAAEQARAAQSRAAERRVSESRVAEGRDGGSEAAGHGGSARKSFGVIDLVTEAEIVTQPAAVAAAGGGSIGVTDLVTEGAIVTQPAAAAALGAAVGVTDLVSEAAIVTRPAAVAASHGAASPPEPVVQAAPAVVVSQSSESGVAAGESKAEVSA